MSLRGVFEMRTRIVLGAALSGGALIVAGHGHRPALADELLAGPDVIYSECTSIMNYGQVGGIRAYALGSNTCNIGNQNLLWLDNGTPGLAMNAYRLHDGRLIQIGQSWVKTACCAAAGQGCGVPCNGQGGNVLGAGCLDVYSAGWNGGQSNLSPRSGINAYTGTFGPIPPGSFNIITRRLQVAEADLSNTAFPGSQYFVEGVYVGDDDADAGNAGNNASYKRITLGAGFNLALTGAMNVSEPAIIAWQEHGLGVNQPDPSVEIVTVDVPNEGRFITASKSKDNGNGTWRYEYAVFNLNSHRSGGSFTVPISASTTVSNTGFHDVLYHSGEPFDNTDWTLTIESGGVTWQSPQAHAQNPNSNALRWGTMYNFWFDADKPPAPRAAGQVTLGLFRPGQAGDPDSVSFGGVTPDTICESDIGGDGQVGIEDLLSVKCPADIDGNAEVEVNDLLAVIQAWGPC
jgi:hypothetical protein